MDNTRNRSRNITLAILVLVIAVLAISAWFYRQTQLPPPLVRELRASGMGVEFFDEDHESDIWRDEDIHRLEISGVVDLRLLVEKADRLPNLAAIHFHDTQFIDLTPLTKLMNLEMLILDTTQVSDLTPLTKMTNLDWLDLSGTQVTDAGVNELKKALPNCQISQFPIMEQRAQSSAK